MTAGSRRGMYSRVLAIRLHSKNHDFEYFNRTPREYFKSAEK